MKEEIEYIYVLSTIDSTVYNFPVTIIGIYNNISKAKDAGLKYYESLEEKPLIFARHIANITITQESITEMRLFDNKEELIECNKRVLENAYNQYKKDLRNEIIRYLEIINDDASTDQHKNLWDIDEYTPSFIKYKFSRGNNEDIINTIIDEKIKRTKEIKAENDDIDNYIDQQYALSDQNDNREFTMEELTKFTDERRKAIKHEKSENRYIEITNKYSLHNNLKKFEYLFDE